MKHRRFGCTGIDISELVFGGGFVGGILIDADDDTRREAIRRALDAGVNWIDTAPSYGQGQSETALGWLLGELHEQHSSARAMKLLKRGVSNISASPMIISGSFFCLSPWDRFCAQR